MIARPKLLELLLVLVPTALACATAYIASRQGCGKPDPCDLDRRLFETAGASSSEIMDRRIPGARLFRYHRNSDLTYASVIGCRPSTGDLLQPDEVFELLPRGGGSAVELAALHAWCFHDGGLAKLEIVLTADRFVALQGPREAFAPPTSRLGVVSFWRADTDTRWHPEPRLYLHVIDSRTGLGRKSRPWSGRDWREDRASLASALGEEGRRGGAFFLLAYRPRLDVGKELMASLGEELDPELRYLGLMALRGEAGVEQVELLGRLAEHESSPLVRMGVVQTLATIPVADARQLATTILQRESDARARRVMQAALKD